ncbi:MAG: pyrophosphate--fructose-6-phosphate 1-phosphotransferase [Puniceicoccales bacterium]|jgi:pyrophosphate--fructose-6-phosphate 1-phosphotransferase|nr:pyrophosphate--fructose-6-phosphate 1-phosphotransferase [Puniceicoccales bacterium]
MKLQTVAILTAGGLAPCLSSAVGGLIERYSEIDPSIDVICYRGGYKGLLLGDKVIITPTIRANASLLHKFGGSPIGNSRVKLTNVKDCVKRGLVKEGENPLKVAADQLVKDGVQVLHTIGGDDTNTAAADLAKFLADNGYGLTVIGLPKTVDNDVYPIRQSLGAWTAAEEGARYFANVVAEHSANPRMLIVHEVMGRNCGWLTAATAFEYRRMLKARRFLENIGDGCAQADVHGIYIPECVIDIAAEAKRLRAVMDELDCVNIFISEGAGVEAIVKEMEAKGQPIPRDAFNHVKLDAINPGKWFGEQFAAMLGAEKTLIQKSGYFARSAPSNTADLALIKSCVDYAVECALRNESGVIGHDDDAGGRLRAIEFPRIKGGKPFYITVSWYRQLLADIGQPPAVAVDPSTQ